MKKNKKIILLILGIAAVVGGLSFYAGTKHVSATAFQRGDSANQFRSGITRSGMSARGVQNGGAFAGGTVISKDETSITVKGRDGSSKVVFFTQATPVVKMVAGSNTDIVAGKEITITGTTNPDGSVTAQSISIRTAQDQKTN